MADGDLHAVNKRDDRKVTIEGVQGELLSFETFDEALRTARRVAKDARCEVLVHRDRVESANQTAA